MSWEKVEIKDICKIKSGKRLPKGATFATYRTQYPYIRARDIKAGVISEDDLVFLTEEVQRKLGRYIVNTGDIVITIAGSVGDVGYVKSRFDGFNLTENAVRLTEFDKRINSQYLLNILNTQKYREIMQQIAGGVAQPKLGIYKIETIPLEIPPIEVQNRIADILSAYDNLIENNKKQIKLLEEAAQRLYKEWFIDLHFPGYKNTQIIDGLPTGWSKKPLSSFGEIITGKTPPTEKPEYYGGSIPFVKIPDMHNCVYPINTEMTLTIAGASTQKNKFIPKNGIMVSCIATVGLVNIATTLCQTNQQINSIILKEKKDLYYIYSTMKRLKLLLEGLGSNGATMTNVNKAKFEKLEVLCPVSELREKYSDFCRPIFEKIYSLSVGINKLTQARDRLLPKLMSGEIEV